MDTNQKNIIKKIKKTFKNGHLTIEEQLKYYNEVYKLYGSDIYKKVTPKRLQKKDLKLLLKQGNFEDIYSKYGKQVYKENLDYMKAKDIENETGSKFRGAISRFNSFVKKNVLIPILGLTFALPTTSIATAKMDKYEEEQAHLNEIEEYIDSIEEYAESVKRMNLSDMEVLMKVTKDMWDNIEGYGNPKIDLIYYPGLDLANEDGVGVCRNMADDIARKLNAINPKYNARVLGVYADGSGYKNANVDINIVSDAHEDNENVENNNEYEEILNKITKVTGNHAVTMLDIPEDNVTLILDPTNPGIGIVKDGKILSLNTLENNEFQENITPMINYINYDTLEKHFKLSSQLLGSFGQPKLTLEELQSKYGLESQNKALESVAKKEESFKDRLVIQLSNGSIATGSLDKEKQEITYEESKEER